MPTVDTTDWEEIDQNQSDSDWEPIEQQSAPSAVFPNDDFVRSGNFMQPVESGNPVLRPVVDQLVRENQQKLLDQNPPRALTEGDLLSEETARSVPLRTTDAPQLSSIYSGGDKPQPITNPYNEIPSAERFAKTKEEFLTPSVPLPKLTINPDDNPVAAVGKEALNILIGIPEFLTSPAGVMTLGAGGVAPRTTAAIFSADMAKSTGEQILGAYKDWDKMTPAQKAAAVTDIVGTSAFSALTAKHALSKTPVEKVAAALNKSELTIPEGSIARGGSPTVYRDTARPSLEISPDVLEGVKPLVDQALRESQQTIVRPGEVSATAELFGKSPELIPEGARNIKQDYQGGQVSFAAEAKAKAVPSARQSAVKPPAPDVVKSAPSTGALNKDLTPEQVAKSKANNSREAFERVQAEANAKKAQSSPLKDNPSPSEFVSATPDQVIEWKRRVKYGNQHSIEIAKQLKPEDVTKLKAERDSLNGNLDVLMKKAREAKSQAESDAALNDFQRIQLKSQTISEILRDKAELLSEPTVTLYRGQDHTIPGGEYWSTDPVYAAKHGKNVQVIEVTKSVADKARADFEATGSATKGAHILPEEIAKTAKELPPEKVPDVVQDLTPGETDKNPLHQAADTMENLKSGIKGGTAGQMNALGIIPAVWDAAVSIAQKVLRAGGSATDAISKAIDYIRQNHKGKFDEQKVRSALDVWKQGGMKVDVKSAKSQSDFSKKPIKTSSDTKHYDVEGESVKMRKSAERATVSEAIPEEVQTRIKKAEESYYKQQSMDRVEEEVSTMNDADLSAVPRDSNLYTAARLEQAKRLFNAGENDKGYSVFVELEKEGTRLGQLINQFKLLKGARPDSIVQVLNSKLKNSGKDPLNETQAGIVIEKTEASKEATRKLDKASKEWMEKPTPENASKAETALTEANKADVDLQSYTSKFDPRTTPQVLKSVLQGNLLTPMSEVANVVGNVAFLPFRAATRTVATGLDIVDNYITGRAREISVQPVSGTIEAAKGFVRGAEKAPSIALKGTGDVIKGETRAGLHPIRAWINQFSENPQMPTKNGKLTLTDRLNLAIEGTFGVPAETLLRGLGIGDQPFREAAKSRIIAEKLKLNGVPKEQWSFAQKFPEFFLDKATMEQVRSDTMASIFQRDSKSLNYLTQLIRSKGDWFDFAVATVAPYKLTPWNIIGEIFTYNPLIAMAKTVKEAKAGNTRQAKMNVAKFAVGTMLWGAGYVLYKNGIISPSLDESDEAQKGRLLSEEVMPPNSINISALKRYLSGGDPAFQKGDSVANYMKAGGLAGSTFYMVANVGRDFERKPASGDADLWQSLISSSVIENARYGVNQSFLSGIEGLLTSVKDGNVDSYLQQWINTVSSIALPNTLTALSRAEREYKVDMKADTLAKKVANVVKTRLGFMGADDYLPLKRDLWGRPIPETPEGRNSLVYNLFDVSKGKQITDDPVALELYRLWRKTANNSVIPSIPARNITVDKQTYLLNSTQYSRLVELIGNNRKPIVDQIVVNPNFHKLSDELKIDILNRVYDIGQQRGKAAFFQESIGELEKKKPKAGF